MWTLERGVLAEPLAEQQQQPVCELSVQSRNVCLSLEPQVFTFLLMLRGHCLSDKRFDRLRAATTHETR